jgi:hypothetical protein
MVACYRIGLYRAAGVILQQTGNTKTAFALAGLGGFNAHGAGFLAAASHSKIVPDLVTATSGQIVVLAAWLQGENLEDLLVLPELEHNPLAQLAIAFSGDLGIFRPAYLETLRRWWTFPLFTGNPVKAFLDRLLPSQLYVPTRQPAEYKKIADTLNAAKIEEHKIGVAFNAYNFETGKTVLFGNDQARSLWPPKKQNPHATKTIGSGLSPTDDEAELLPITPKDVQSALWLSLYGFSHLPIPHLMDGAYSRSCLISELHEFNHIFVARPLAQGWTKKAPSNWFEVQDWQTEMWFSASYKAEVDTLNQINGLVRDKLLKSPFKQVELIEVAPETPAGYFNFFIERKKIYDRAYKCALEKFAAYRSCPAPPATDFGLSQNSRG